MMLGMKGKGKPMRVPITMIKVHKGNAFGLENPPIRVKMMPPKMTPLTGPVTAATEKLMVAVVLSSPRACTQ